MSTIRTLRRRRCKYYGVHSPVGLMLDYDPDEIGIGIQISREGPLVNIDINLGPFMVGLDFGR